MSNKELYKLREKWLELIAKAKELDSLSPEEQKQYGIEPSSRACKFENEDAGKFLDDYYHYLYLKDLSSEDPLTANEIGLFKEEQKEAFNEATQYLHGRDCRFESVIEFKFATDLNKYADRVNMLTSAIAKASEEIKPEYHFYKRSYRFDVKVALKQIDKDIELYQERIDYHKSCISSIGYEHYEDGELGLDDYDVQERYKPHAESLAKLRENIELLKSFKTKLIKDDEQEELEDNQQPTKKVGFIKRILNKFKRKKKNAITPVEQQNNSKQEEPKIEHAGGAWHSDW